MAPLTFTLDTVKPEINASDAIEPNNTQLNLKFTELVGLDASALHPDVFRVQIDGVLTDVISVDLADAAAATLTFNDGGLESKNVRINYEDTSFGIRDIAENWADTFFAVYSSPIV